jgi:hypothetical protein
VLILLVVLPTLNPPKVFDPKPIDVSLVDASVLFAPKPSVDAAPAPKKKPVPPPKKATTHKTVVQSIARPTHAPPTVHHLVADQEDGVGQDPGLSDAQLAGATAAGSGSGSGAGVGAGGRQCDMASRVQAALRKDPLVGSSVSGYGGKAIIVWNGDWVWIRGDIGKGLTAVRQAMMWEIAFAPAACKAEPMHGLVVFNVSGPQGPVRLAIGGGQWRWADLLVPHPGRA